MSAAYVAGVHCRFWTFLSICPKSRPIAFSSRSDLFFTVPFAAILSFRLGLALLGLPLSLPEHRILPRVLQDIFRFIFSLYFVPRQPLGMELALPCAGHFALVLPY